MACAQKVNKVIDTTTDTTITTELHVEIIEKHRDFYTILLTTSIVDFRKFPQLYQGLFWPLSGVGTSLMTTKPMEDLLAVKDQALDGQHDSEGENSSVTYVFFC